MENEQRAQGSSPSSRQESGDEWTGYLADVFEPVFKKRSARSPSCAASATRSTRSARSRSLAGAGCARNRTDATETWHSSTRSNCSSTCTPCSRSGSARSGEAVAGRDRRYKKNVTRTLYLKDNVPEMKRVEAALDKNELKQELGRRPALANCTVLWKAVKASVKRGVEENDGYAEEILAAAAAVRTSRAAAGRGGAARRRARDGARGRGGQLAAADAPLPSAVDGQAERGRVRGHDGGRAGERGAGARVRGPEEAEGAARTGSWRRGRAQREGKRQTRRTRAWVGGRLDGGARRGLPGAGGGGGGGGGEEQALEGCVWRRRRGWNWGCLISFSVEVFSICWSVLVCWSTSDCTIFVFTFRRVDTI